VLAALELMRERTAMEVEIRLRGDVLDELISGEFVEDLIVGRGRALGFDFTRPARVYIVEPSAPGDRPLQPEGALTSPHPLYRTVFECAGQWGENLVAPRGAGVLVVVYEDDRAPMPFEDVLQRTCRERLKGTRLTIGAGTACTRPVDYRQSFMAARRGVDLMHLLGRADDVFSFRRRRVEHMLLETSDPRALVSFVATYVRPLDEWDRRHSSQLRKTLEAVFATGFNLEQAARTLHLHVSTLRYRLKKIGELLGVDLKDADVRLDVQVALKAARTLDVHRG
jgi:sugar diacid utilization regulator